MFSDNLLYLRNLKGLSQEQVAEAVGISRQSYSKWEQGDTFPDIDKCDKLAKFYGVTIDSLIHADEKIGKTKIAPRLSANIFGEQLLSEARGKL